MASSSSTTSQIESVRGFIVVFSSIEIFWIAYRCIVVNLRQRNNIFKINFNCVKSFCIRSFSGPYSVRMWESTGQKNSKYGHFSHSV